MDYLNLSSKHYKKCKTLEEKFKLLASHVLNDFKLNVGANECSLEEIELYYHSSNHKDEYVHKDADQLNNSEWYFHKYKNGTHKSGTYKGMDITFGDGKKTYGGILIRSIKDLRTKEFISGPCKVVNYILAASGYNATNKLAESMDDLLVFNDKNSLYINHEECDDNSHIFSGPRVGLSLKYPEYLVKDYRFLKSPKQVSKYKDTIVSSLYRNGMDIDDIYDLTDLCKNSIKKALESYNEGKNMTSDEIENVGVNKINVLYGYYCNK